MLVPRNYSNKLSKIAQIHYTLQIRKRQVFHHKKLCIELGFNQKFLMAKAKATLAEASLRRLDKSFGYYVFCSTYIFTWLLLGTHEAFVFILGEG